MTRLATGMQVRIVDSEDVGTLIQIREASQTCVIKLTSGALRKNVPLDDVKEARGGADGGGAKSPIRLGGAVEPLALPSSMASGSTSPAKRNNGASVKNGSLLEVGDAVRARYKKGAKWFDGKILKVRADGTYDVQYDDGDVEMKVDAQYVEAVEAVEKPPKLSLSPVKSPLGKATTPRFTVGDKVKARYKKGAKLFNGKVTKAHADGSYDIRYDDGDVETHVEASYIQGDRDGESPRAASSPKKSNASKSRVEFEVGDKVKARYKKGTKLFAGKIMKAHADGSYDIRYEDGDTEARVGPQYIEAITTNEDRAVSSPTKSVSKPQQRRIGDKVRARYKKGAKFFNGTVTKVHADGSVDIRYEDGDTESRVELKYIEAVTGEASDAEEEPRKGKSASKAWRVDDAVMAKYKKGKKLYAGTIKRVHSDGTYDIRYEDGDVETRVEAQYIEPPPERATSPRASSPKKSSPSVEVGDKVKARYKGGARLLPGKIIKARVDGTFDVKFEDGDVETGVEPRHIESAQALETDKVELLEEGDRVTARYKKGAKFFPGRVAKVHADGTYDIKYEDGDTETRVALAMIQRQEASARSSEKTEEVVLRVGDPVKARYKKGAKYFTGKIKRVRTDGTYDVEYDDGDVELQVAMTYIEAVEKPKSPKKKAAALEVGDAVKARYKKGAKLFQGVIKRVRLDGTYDIKYEDGDVETSVELEFIEREGGDKDGDLKKESGGGFDVGDKVKARYKNSQKWYDGRISRVRGDGTYDVEYDDGELELRIDASKIEAVGVRARASPTKKAKEIRVGDGVQARYKGGKKLFAAEITRVRTDGTYDLKYEDGDTETRVERGMIETSDSTQTDDDTKKKGKAGKLGVGDAVLAQYKGGKKMYRGKITRVRADGSYDIEYEDGDRELNVPAERVQPAQEERKKSSKEDAEKDRDAELAIGDAVQAYYKRGKKLYGGKITRCHADDTFDVQYEDGDVEKRVERKLIVVEQKKGRAKSKLKVGDPVKAKHQKSASKRVRGQISKERIDGTFDIEFDDGEVATRVELDQIEVLSDSDSQADGGQRKTKKSFEVGDAVKARYKKGAKLFAGKIMRVRSDGTYDVKYEDGDVETSVDAEYIESVDTKTTKRDDDPGLDAGDAVSARYKNGAKWYDGTVKRVRADGTLDIRYEDGDVEERVKAENVRRTANNRGEDERARSPKRPARAKWTKGDEVEADYKEKGRYRHAIILRVHDDGSVDVEYDNGDVEKRVASSLARGVERDEREKDTGKSSRSSKPNQSSSDSEDIKRPKKRGEKASAASSDSDDERRPKKTKPKIAKSARVTMRKAVDAKSRRVGRVKKLHGDGSCDVEYTNGDIAKQIASDALLLCSDGEDSDNEKPKASKRRGLFKRDQSVVACWRRQTRMAKPVISDRWDDAVILAISDDGTYSIRYRNGEMEEDVPEEAIKPRGEPPKALSTTRQQEPRELLEVDVVFLLEQLAMTLYEEGELKKKPRLRFSGVAAAHSSSSGSDSGSGSESSVSNEGKRSSDSSSKLTKASTRKRPRGAVDKALQKMFDAKLLKKYQTMFDEHDADESGRISKSKIIQLVDDLCSQGAPDATRDNTVRRLLTEWFTTQDSLRTHSKFDFPTLMMAFAVAKHHLSKAKIHQNMANALEARFASHHESKKQLELWQQKLGFRMFETLQRFFHDSALPRMYPAQVRVSEIASIFDQVTRSAVPNKPLEVYLKQMHLLPHHTLHLPEFMCCYYQLYGSQDVSRAPVWAEQLELRPVAFVASCLFSNGDACCERHGDLVRRLCIGRTPTQVDMVMRFREVFESLQSADGSDGSDTTISTSLLETFASKVIGDPSLLEQSVLALRKRTAAVSLVELFATCGFVIDEVTAAPTVVNAIEKMRLRTEAAEVRRIIGLVRNMCLKVLRFPNNPDYWRLRSDSAAFHQKIGRFDGATSLLESVGFLEYGKTHFELRGARVPDGKRTSSLPKATLDTLRDRCAELDSELSVMDGVESVVSILQRIAKEREHDTPLSLEECEDTLRNLATYIDNVLKNPKDSRCWRIRESNKTFQRQVGYLPFHADLMASIGYDFATSSQGNVYTLRGTGLGKTKAEDDDKASATASLANFAFSSLSSQMEWFLWRRKQEIESLLQDDMEYLVQMLGPSTSSTAHTTRGGFSASMARLKDSGPTAGKMYPYGRNALEIFSKTQAQKAQLEMIKTLFALLDHTKRGFLRTEDLDRKPPLPRWASFDCFDLDKDGRVDFADFVGALGPALDHSFDPLDVGEFVPLQRMSLSEQVSTLVGRLRLTATLAEATAVLDATISSLNRVLGQPAAAEVRTVAAKSPLAAFSLRLLAVKELLHLAGYRPPTPPQATPPSPASPSQAKDSKPEVAWVLQPQQPIRFETTANLSMDTCQAPPLDSQTLSRLQLITAMLGGHARLLVFPAVSDVGAVARAIGQTRPVADWIKLVELVVLCLENILKHPDDEHRYRQLKTSTQTFTSVVAKIVGGVQLFLAIGFRETDRGTLVLPDEIKRTEIIARQLELTVGCQILRIADKLSQQGIDESEFPSATSPRRVEGGGDSAVDYYKRKALAAELAREEALRKSAHLEKQLEIVAKTHPRRSIGPAPTTPTARARAVSAHVTQTRKQKEATRPVSPNLRASSQPATFSDSGYSIEAEILAEFSPRKCDTDRDVLTTKQAVKAQNPGRGGRGGRGSSTNQSLRGNSSRQPPKSTQRRPPRTAPSSTTPGTLEEATLAVDADAGSSFIIVRSSHSSLQQGALVRVGTENRDLTEERLIVDVDHASYPNLTKIALHYPLRFPHFARDLVFVLPPKALNGADQLTLAAELVAFIQGDVLNRIINRAVELSTTSPVGSPLRPSPRKTVQGAKAKSAFKGAGSLALVHEIDLPTHALVSIGGLCCEQLVVSTQTTPNLTIVHEVVTLRKLRAVWEGLVMQFGGGKGDSVVWRHVSDVVRKIPSLAMHQPKPSGSDKARELLTWESFITWLRFPLGDGRLAIDSHDEDSAEQLLALSLLRQHFRALVSDSVDANGVFSLVPADELVKHASTSLLTLTHSPVEARDLTAVQALLTRLTTSATPHKTAYISWSEAVYRVRHGHSLQTPELFPVTTTTSLHGNATSIQPRLVLAVTSARLSSLLFVLLADGYMEVWRSNSRGSSALVARVFVLFSPSSSASGTASTTRNNSLVEDFFSFIAHAKRDREWLERQRQRAQSALDAFIKSTSASRTLLSLTAHESCVVVNATMLMDNDRPSTSSDLVVFHVDATTANVLVRPLHRLRVKPSSVTIKTNGTDLSAKSSERVVSSTGVIEEYAFCSSGTRVAFKTVGGKANSVLWVADSSTGDVVACVDEFAWLHDSALLFAWTDDQSPTLCVTATKASYASVYCFGADHEKQRVTCVLDSGIHARSVLSPLVTSITAAQDTVILAFTDGALGVWRVPVVSVWYASPRLERILPLLIRQTHSSVRHVLTLAGNNSDDYEEPSGLQCTIQVDANEETQLDAWEHELPDHCVRLAMYLFADGEVVSVAVPGRYTLSLITLDMMAHVHEDELLMTSREFERVLLQPERVVRVVLIACEYLHDGVFAQKSMQELLDDMRQKRLLQMTQSQMKRFTQAYSDSVRLLVRCYYRAGDSTECALVTPLVQQKPPRSLSLVLGLTTEVKPTKKHSAPSMKLQLWSLLAPHSPDLLPAIHEAALSQRAAWELEASRLRRQHGLLSVLRRRERVSEMRREILATVKRTLTGLFERERSRDAEERVAEELLSSIQQLCRLEAFGARGQDPVKRFVRGLLLDQTRSVVEILRTAERDATAFRPWLQRLRTALASDSVGKSNATAESAVGLIRQWRREFLSIASLCDIVSELGILDHLAAEKQTPRLDDGAILQQFCVFALSKRAIPSEKTKEVDTDSEYNQLLTFIHPRLAVEFLLRSCDVGDRVKKCIDVLADRCSVRNHPQSAQKDATLPAQAAYAQLLVQQRLSQRLATIEQRHLVCQQSAERPIASRVSAAALQNLRRILKTSLPSVGPQVSAVTLRVPLVQQRFAMRAVVSGEGFLDDAKGSSPSSSRIPLSIVLFAGRDVRLYQRESALYRRLHLSKTRDLFLPVIPSAAVLPILRSEHLPLDATVQTLVVEALDGWRTLSQCVHLLRRANTTHSLGYWQHLVAFWCRQVLLGLAVLEDEKLSLSSLHPDSLIVSPDGQQVRFAALNLTTEENGKSTDNIAAFGAFVVLLCELFVGDPIEYEAVRPCNDFVRLKETQQRVWEMWSHETDADEPLPGAPVVDFMLRHVSSTYSSLSRVVAAALLTLQPQGVCTRPESTGQLWALTFADAEDEAPQSLATEFAWTTDLQAQLEELVLHPLRSLSDGALSALTAAALVERTSQHIDTIVCRLLELPETCEWQLNRRSVGLCNLSHTRVLIRASSTAVLLFERCMSVGQRDAAHRVIQVTLDVLRSILRNVETCVPLSTLLSDADLQSLVCDTVRSFCVICSASPTSESGVSIRMSPPIQAALWRLSERHLRELVNTEPSATVVYPVVQRFLQVSKTSLAEALALELDTKSPNEPLFAAWWRQRGASHATSASIPLCRPSSVVHSAFDVSLDFLALALLSLELRFNTSNAASAAAVKFRLAALQSCLSPDLLDRKTLTPLVFARDLTARVWLHLDMASTLHDALRDPDDRIVYGALSTLEAYTRVLRATASSSQTGEPTERVHLFGTSPPFQLAVTLGSHCAILSEVTGLLSRLVRSLKMVGEAGVNAAISSRYGSNSSRVANPVALLSVAMAFLVNCLHGGDECSQQWVASGLSSVILAHAKAGTLPFVKVSDSNWMNNSSTLSSRPTTTAAQWSVFTFPSHGLQKTSPFELLLRDFVAETAIRSIALTQHWRSSSSFFRQLLETQNSTASVGTQLVSSSEFGRLSHVWDCVQDIDECDGTLDEKRCALEYAVAAIRQWLATLSSAPVPLVVEKLCGVAWSWLDTSVRALLRTDATDENASTHAATVTTAQRLLDIIVRSVGLSTADLRRITQPADRLNDGRDDTAEASDSVFGILLTGLRSTIKSCSSESSQPNPSLLSVFCSSMELLVALIDPSQTEEYRAGVLLQQFVGVKRVLRLLKTDSVSLAQCCSTRRDVGLRYASKWKRRLWASLLHRGDRDVARVILDEGLVEFWLEHLFDQDVPLGQEEDSDVDDSAVAAVNGRLEVIAFFEMLLHAQQMMGRRHSLMMQLITTELVKCVLHLRTISTEKQRVLTYTQFCRTHQSRQSTLPTLAARMIATAKRIVQLMCCLAVDSTTDQIDDAAMAALGAAGIPGRVVEWHQQRTEVAVDMKRIREFWDLWPEESASLHASERRRPPTNAEVRVVVPQPKNKALRQQPDPASPPSISHRVQFTIQQTTTATVNTTAPDIGANSRRESSKITAPPRPPQQPAPSSTIAVNLRTVRPDEASSVPASSFPELSLSPTKRTAKPEATTHELRESVVQTLMSIDMESARVVQQQQLRAERRRRSKAKRATESRSQVLDERREGEDEDSLGSDAYSPFSDSDSDIDSTVEIGKKPKDDRADRKPQRKKKQKQAKEEKKTSDVDSSESSYSGPRRKRSGGSSSNSSSSSSASPRPRRNLKTKKKPTPTPAVTEKPKPSQPPSANEAALRQIFTKYDVDGDGAIGFVDLQRVLGPTKLSNVELQRWIAEKDRRGVGAVDFEDFVFAFTHTPATQAAAPRRSQPLEQPPPRSPRSPGSPLLRERGGEQRVVLSTHATRQKKPTGRGYRLGGGGRGAEGGGGGEYEAEN